MTPPRTWAPSRRKGDEPSRCIVVEAGTKCGSLDTAARARKQGRLVYAVPGSAGTDGLLRTGGKQLDADTSLDTLAQEIRRHPLPQTEVTPPNQQARPLLRARQAVGRRHYI